MFCTEAEGCLPWIESSRSIAVFMVIEDEFEQTTGREQRSDTSLAKLRKQHCQTKDRSDEQDARFKILPAAQEMIPCPDVLREGRGKDRNGGDDQKKTANGQRRSTSVRPSMTSWQARDESVLQRSPRANPECTLPSIPSLEGSRCECQTNFALINSFDA